MPLVMEMSIITKKSVATTDRYIRIRFLKVVSENVTKPNTRLRAFDCSIRFLITIANTLCLVVGIMVSLIFVP